MDITHEDWCDCGRTAGECQDARQADAREGIYS